MHLQPGKAIPTVYGGITFRSRFEANVAQFLDRTYYNWYYEHESHLLPNGLHYAPDFWIPALRLYVEARGYETAKGREQIRGFAELIEGGSIMRPLVEGGLARHCAYMVIGPQNVTFFDLARPDVRRGGSPAMVGTCAECSESFFFGAGQSQQCRMCGYLRPDGQWDLQYACSVEISDNKPIYWDCLDGVIDASIFFGDPDE